MYHWQTRRSRTFLRIAALGMGLLISGCATQRVARQGEKAMKRGNWDGAVYYYLEALSSDPDNVEYKMALIRARQKAAQEHFRRAMTLKQLGKLIPARDELRMAVELDPTHQFAEQELRQVEQDIEVLSRPNGKQTLEEMKKKAAEAKVKPPILNPRSKEPITLSFPRPTPVKEIYKALAKAFGFNVLFDPKLKDDKITVELNDVTAERALETVMQGAGHFYKVLDEHSIIVADDTPQNRRKYEDLVIKTFFLSNAEVKDIDKLLRSLIEARRLATNEQLNAITLRDTADKVAIAEKLIQTNDKAKAEVMVDVELMEVNASKIRNLGASLSTYAFTISRSGADDDNPASVSLNGFSNIFNGNDWVVNIPSVMVNLIQSSSDAVSLAQPHMRITEGEKGSLVIGDRQPIPVTTFNTANTVGGNVVPLTSYQYQDVGIKIDVEPRVHHNREITLKLKVEVSQVNGYTDAQYPIIGTRTINTVIRLKDGETSMLVGLYKEDKSISRTETPGLSRIPILGHLFTNDSRNKKTTDLVLTLTPHIIRFPDIEEEDLAPLWVGTESRISFFGSSPRVHSGSQAQGPFDEGPGGGVEQETKPPKPRQQVPRAMPRRIGARGRGGLRGRQPAGVPLVPPANKQEAPTLGGEGTPGGGEAVSGESAGGPALALNPSVLTLAPGSPATLELVGTGFGKGTELPLTLSFDPSRLRVDSVEPGEDVMVDAQQAPGAGWVTLTLRPGRDAAAGPLARLRVTTLAPGPVPVVCAADSLVTSSGGRVPVAVSGSAIYVEDNGGEVQ